MSGLFGDFFGDSLGGFSAWSEAVGGRWVGAAIQGSLAALVAAGLWGCTRGHGPSNLRTWAWRAADLVFLFALFSPIAVRVSLPEAAQLGSIVEVSAVGEGPSIPGESRSDLGPGPMSALGEGRSPAIGSQGRGIFEAWPWVSLAILVMGLRTLAGVRRAWRFRIELQSARPCSRLELRKLLGDLGQGLGMKRVPDLLELPGLAAPCVVGCLRPRVVIPAGWGVPITTEIRAALVHELTHVRRHDLPWAALRSCVDLLFFPLPFLGWRGRRAELESELACDRAAVVGTGIDRRAYGELLLGLSNRVVASGGFALGGLSIGRKESMETRLLALYADPLAVDDEGTSPGAKGTQGWGGLVALGIVAPLIVPYRIEHPGGSEFGVRNRRDDRAEQTRSGLPLKTRERSASHGDPTDPPITIFRNLGEESVEVRMNRTEGGVLASVRWSGPRPSVNTYSLARIEELAEHDPRALDLVLESLRPRGRNAWLFRGTPSPEPTETPKEKAR